MVNFGILTKKFSTFILTHPKLTLWLMQRRLMRLRSPRDVARSGISNP